jgi:hypothetical protein
MPYQPTTPPVNPTGIDTATPSKDFAFMNRMIKAKFEGQYAAGSLATYRALKKATTFEGDDVNQLVGEDGTTKYDPLYGDSMDPDMTVWEQPHLSGVHQAGAVELYDPPVDLPVKVPTEETDREQTLRGTEVKADLTVYVPTVILDERGITVKPGDWITFRGIDYIVRSVSTSKGRWHNVGVPLYLDLGLVVKRQGS